MAKKRYRRERPRVGESVYDGNRQVSEGDQPNGCIVHIEYSTSEIVCVFDKKQKVYDFIDFEGRWTDKFNGQWIIND